MNHRHILKKTKQKKKIEMNKSINWFQIQFQTVTLIDDLQIIKNIINAHSYHQWLNLIVWSS